jgi:hypothetical protein
MHVLKTILHFIDLELHKQIYQTDRERSRYETMHSYCSLLHECSDVQLKDSIALERFHAESPSRYELSFSRSATLSFFNVIVAITRVQQEFSRGSADLC